MPLKPAKLCKPLIAAALGWPILDNICCCCCCCMVTDCGLEIDPEFDLDMELDMERRMEACADKPDKDNGFSDILFGCANEFVPFNTPRPILGTLYSKFKIDETHCKM